MFMQQEWGTERSETNWETDKQDWTSCGSGLHNPQGLSHLPSPVGWETCTDIQDTAIRKCSELLILTISLVSRFPKKCLIAALAQSPGTHRLVSFPHPVHNYLSCLVVVHVPNSLNYSGRTVNSLLHERRLRKPLLVWQANFPSPCVLTILTIEIG